MHERGQASVEWVGAVLLIALVAGALTFAALDAQGVASAVVRQFHRALCIVGGGQCDLDRRPCVTGTDMAEQVKQLDAVFFRVGRHKVMVAERRSDGTVDVTFIKNTDVGVVGGWGSDVIVGQTHLGKLVSLARLARVGGGTTYHFANESDARAGMALIADGEEPRAATRTRVRQGGTVMTFDALLRPTLPRGKGTYGVEAHVSSEAILATAVDEATGRRTHVLSGDLQGDVTAALLGVRVNANGRAAGHVALVTDAQGRPIELELQAEGELGGAVDLPARAQEIAGELLADRSGRRRWVLEQRLDLTEPENAGAMAALLRAGADPRRLATAARDLAGAVADRGVTQISTYDVEQTDSAVGAHVARGWQVGGMIADSGERTTLTNVRQRGPEGVWTRRGDCLAPGV